MERDGWVYIMANRYRGEMYVGITSDLIRRVWQHRAGAGSVHVADFDRKRLVHAERHREIGPAIAREKPVKEVAPGVEVRADRGRQSAMARPVGGVASFWRDA
jgi:predicted GIY-YIG superfamily endonuclease